MSSKRARPFLVAGAALVLLALACGGSSDSEDELTTTATPSNQQSADPQARLNEGIEASDAGRFGEAVRLFAEAIEAEPEFTEAYIRRAGALIDLGRYDEAISDATKAIELAPEGPTLAVAYFVRIEALVQLRRHNEVVNDASKIIEIGFADSDFIAQTLLNRSGAYVELGHAEEALADADAFLALKPAPDVMAIGHGFRSRALGILGRAVAAKEACDMARELGYTGRCGSEGETADATDVTPSADGRDGDVDVALLRPGECFQDPVGTRFTQLPSDGPPVEPEVVTVVSCSEPHDNEVFHLLNLTEEDEWPGLMGLWALSQERCEVPFESYVGRPHDSSRLVIFWIGPTEESWNDEGDRAMVCVLFDTNSSDLLGSMRGSQE